MPLQKTCEVFQLSTLAEFASLRRRWNELACGMPLRSWEWLENWWRLYGNAPQGRPTRGRLPAETVQKELYLLVVFEAPDHLVGIAPWYIEHTPNAERTLRFLGSGEVCTDYSTILCEPGKERLVASALARTLSDPLHDADGLTHNTVRHWDRIEFEANACDDLIMRQLLHELEGIDNLVHRRPAESTWRISLPETWDGYLAMLSKSHRKQIRRAQRDYFDTGRARVNWVTDEAQLETAWHYLVNLHQSRQASLGRAGCFYSERYYLFHLGMLERLLKEDRLWLGWLELDGRVIAADYHLVGASTVYAYQGGIDPAALQFAPGQLLMMASIRRAIDEGMRNYDLLRGNEPYKAHWRAEPHATEQARVIKRTRSNQVRKGLWVASDQLKQWFRASFGSPVGTL